MRLKHRKGDGSDRLRLLNEPSKVAVYCDAGSHDRWYVSAIHVSPRWSGGSHTIPSGGLDVDGAPFVDRSRRPDGVRPEHAYLIGDEVATPGRGSTDRRVRWNFKCPQCGDSLTVRGERLESVLEELIRRGIGEVSLRGLRVAVG